MVWSKWFSFSICGILLAACDATGTAPSSSPGDGPLVVAQPVALQTSGTDSCGAVDYKFLEGQPLANTYDLRMPAGTRYLGRTMKRDATSPRRLTVVVSTRSPQMAFFEPTAKVVQVYCG